MNGSPSVRKGAGAVVKSAGVDEQQASGSAYMRKIDYSYRYHAQKTWFETRSEIRMAVCAVDLVLTRSLLAVAQHGAITEAARALGVTQPALSRRIQLLEQELDAELLERSRRGVSLTEAGRIAVAQGKQLVERFDRMRDDLRAHRDLEAGTVRIGGGATAVAFLLPPAIAGFQSDHPGVRFQVKEAGSREVEADVIAEQLELGVVTLPVRTGEVTVRPLREDRIVPIAARDHPLAARQRIRATRLSEYGVVGFEAGSAIRQLIDASLRQAGVEMNVVMELRSIPAIIAMVSATRNLAFVSDLGVDGKDGPVCRLAVQGLRISRRLAIVSKRGRPLSPAALAFSEKLGERSEKLGERSEKLEERSEKLGERSEKLGERAERLGQIR